MQAACYMRALLLLRGAFGRYQVDRAVLDALDARSLDEWRSVPAPRYNRRPAEHRCGPACQHSSVGGSSKRETPFFHTDRHPNERHAGGY